MKKLSLFFATFAVAFSVMAQTNLSFQIKVAASENILLLDTFPTVFATEKINISLASSQYDRLELTDLSGDGLAQYDYLLLADAVMPSQLHESFDSIYAFTLSTGKHWTLLENNKEIKNKQKRATTRSAYDAFVFYFRSQTQEPSRFWTYLGYAGAALLLLLLLVPLVGMILRKNLERTLTPLQKETLRRKRADKRRHIFSQCYLWVILLVLYAPIILIVIFSFTESKILGNWTGFSTNLYFNLFAGKGGAGLNSAIFNTVSIALIAATVSTLLGTLAAIGIYNMRARQRKVISFLNSIPMINPDIITGISLFLLFVALGVSQGFTTVCIAHIVFCTPYVVLSVLPRLSQMNPNTYEAALDLGATPFVALRKVMMPELWPGMLSGFVLALTLSVDDFGVTFFTKGSGGLETLSTFIYSDARKGGLTPELRPLFSLILIVVLVVLIYINVRAERQNKKN